MDDLWILILLLVAIAAGLSAIVLPIIALVISIRSRKKVAEQVARLHTAQALGPDTLQQLRISDLAPLAKALKEIEARTANLEAALTAQSIRIPQAVAAQTEPVIERAAPPPPTGSLPRSETAAELTPSSPVVPPSPPLITPLLSTPQTRAIQAERIESIIGRRWLGWAAVGLILFAAAFFLKYAFDNRWIGELGRVAIGVTAGVSLTMIGFKYHQRGWWIFSQILTAGGVVLLYLSDYAAFGYYHLATQKAAFAYLAILVAEAAGLALLYEAPAIAIMALIGGFLAPVLLRSDRDQYGSLFGYIAVLDIGALALLKRWTGLSSLAFGGTHLLFWLWYADHYHPRKLTAVMIFQTGVFLLFLLAHLGRRLIRRQSASLEDLGLLLINSFVFFATAYYLLNSSHHDWMGVFAIGMALVYAGAAKVLLDRSTTTRSEVLVLIGISLTFVTLAIPIHLRANWITIAWSVAALTMLWVGFRTKSIWVQASACGLFVLALWKLALWDTPVGYRPMFTPVLNKYFLSSFAVTACLFGAAALCQKFGKQKLRLAPKLYLVVLLIAIITLWFVMSVETQTFFSARAVRLKLAGDAGHEGRLGQMALSVLWSLYAGTLAAVGFIRRSAAVRWAALGLFGLTIIKVMMVDIAELQQLYRIIAFLVLGLLLLVVAWGYHKAFQSRESSK